MKRWAVYFREHVHVDRYGQLAIFDDAEHAVAWFNKNAFPGCSIRKICIEATV